ncbi:MAG: restriction endonuclease, partial [Nitrososphaerales archaeon]
MVVLRADILSIDEDDLLAKAEQLGSRVLEALRTIERECFSHGISPRFSFNTSSGYLIQGSCFVQPDDAESIAESKRRRLNVWKYVDAFSTMDPQQFERVCRGVLSLLGVQDAVTTPRSGDDGVDFFGNLALDGMQNVPLFSPNFASHLRIIVMGQAKRYKHIWAGTPELRSLFGAIELAKAGVTELTDTKKMPLKVRVADPVIYLFV